MIISLTVDKFDEDLYYFYEEYRSENPFLLFFKFIVTFGFYTFYWIYELNILLEKIDDNAPSSNKLFIILFLLPSLFYLFKHFLLNWMNFEVSFIFISVSFIIWSSIIFISLLGVYKFCMSYGKLTNTNELVWCFLIYPAYIAIVLFFYDFYYTLPLLLISFASLAFMQHHLNIKIINYERHIESDIFNSIPRKK